MSAAVKHLLRQMQRDPRLAYLIGPGSESYALLTEEAAAAAGQAPNSFRTDFEKTLTFEPWPSDYDIQCRMQDGKPVPVASREYREALK